MNCRVNYIHSYMTLKYLQLIVIANYVCQRCIIVVLCQCQVWGFVNLWDTAFPGYWQNKLTFLTFFCTGSIDPQDLLIWLYHYRSRKIKNSFILDPILLSINLFILKDSEISPLINLQLYTQHLKIITYRLDSWCCVQKLLFHYIFASFYLCNFRWKNKKNLNPSRLWYMRQ